MKDLSMRIDARAVHRTASGKKRADAIAHPEALDHDGLLVD
jgi:hypothetical protein